MNRLDPEEEYNYRVKNRDKWDDVGIMSFLLILPHLTMRGLADRLGHRTTIV
jgi:hypothetical protein